MPVTKPVAEGGEFLVLGAVAFDEVEEGCGGVELLDESLFQVGNCYDVRFLETCSDFGFGYLIGG